MLNVTRYFDFDANRGHAWVSLRALLFAFSLSISFGTVALSNDVPSDTVTTQELGFEFRQGDADFAPSPTIGISRPAWSFDGHGEFLDLVVEDKIQQFNAISIACWIKLDDMNGPASHTILSWKDRTGSEYRLFVLRPDFKGRNYRLGFTSTHATVLTDDPDHLVKQITPTLTSEMWYLLGLTVGKGKIVFYVDGVAVHEETIDNMPPLGISEGRLGIDKSGEGEFAGSMGKIRISAGVWTAQQMASMYRRELGDTRLTANREELVADFPAATSHLKDPKSDWARALDAPYWYSKAWNWNQIQQSQRFDDDAAAVIAAFDSTDREGADFVCDGKDDDVEIQQALDAVPKTGGKVLLREGTYRLGTALMPQSNTELVINGFLRVDGAVTSKLAKDAKPGGNAYQVADAEKFRVGQWVTAVDDQSIDHKEGLRNWRGGRKYGRCGVISSIAGDTISIEDVPADYGDRGKRSEPPRYRQEALVVANALLTTCHSAIVVQGKQHVYIHGSGNVFGNRMQQQRTAPTSNWHHWEEMRANSGIVVFDSSFVRIEGLQVHDAALHNVTFWMTENCTAEGLNVFGANDKNIVSIRSNRLRLVDNHAHDSVCEDGIIFYVLGHSGLIGKNRMTDNARYGMHLHRSCRHMTSIRNIALFNNYNTTLSPGGEQRSLSIDDVFTEPNHEAPAAKPANEPAT